MKLVYKNILINTIVSLTILLMGEYSLYVFLKRNMEKETIEHLNIERHVMLRELKRGVNIDFFKHNIGDNLTITPIKNIEYKSPVITDELIEEEWEEEHFTSKKITFDVAQDNRFYRVSITKTIDEDEGLTGNMSAIIFISGLCMLTALVLINVIIFHRLFSPVYRLIKDVKSFSVHTLTKISIPKTSTKELAVLNEEISKMSEKIISDYASMKEFTENMTHEIQTPLAIINTKIERCLQDKALTEEQANLLSGASKAVNKLFNISKGLTLLSKLDNQQYVDVTEIKIGAFIRQRIGYLHDFIERKEITLTEDYTSDFIVKMDHSLCEILLDNLLKNAIRHNIQGGRITITLKNNFLIISNDGLAPKTNTDEFFKRFYSHGTNTTLGLGLSIVKKIIEYYGFGIQYEFSHEIHSIRINFKSDRFNVT
jgi:signal transduction histidine kinase